MKTAHNEKASENYPACPVLDETEGPCQVPAFQIPQLYEEALLIKEGDPRKVALGVGGENCYSAFLPIDGPSVLLSIDLNGLSVLELSLAPKDARLLAALLVSRAQAWEDK